MKSRVAQGLLWGQLGRLLEITLQFGFSFLVIRQLPVADYGRYGLAMGIVMLITLVSSYGLGDAARRFLPEFAAGPQPGQARYLLDQLLMVRSAGLVLCCGILALLHRQIFGWFGLSPDGTLLLIVLAFGCTAAFDELLAGALTAGYNLRALYRVRVWSRALSLLAALALLRWGRLSLVGVLLILLAAQAAGDLAMWLSRHGRWSEARPVAMSLSAPLRFGLTTWGGQFLTFVLEARSDVMLLGLLLADTRQVAFYNAGMVALLAPLGIVMTAPNSLALPAFTEALTRGGPAALARAAESFWKLFLVGGLPICIFGAMSADRVVVAAFGAQYLPAAGVMRAAALAGVAALLLGQGVFPGLLYALGLQKQDLKLRIAAAVVNVVLALLLIPRFGAIGAVLATAAAAIGMFAAEALLARRALEFHFPWRVAAKVLLISGVLCAAIRPLVSAGWVQLVLGTVGFAAAFLIVLSIVKVLDPRDRAILHGSGNPLVEFLASRY